MMMQNPRVKAALDAVSGSTLISFILDYLCSEDTAIHSVGGVLIYLIWACIIDISTYFSALLDDS